LLPRIFNLPRNAQFFDPAANGNIDNGLLGQVVKAAPPRLTRAALMFTF